MLFKIWKFIKLYKNWPTFFLMRLGLIRKNKVLLKFRNGLKWYVDSRKSGTGVISDVWLAKPYDFLLENKPKLIIDVGTHIGSFSIKAAHSLPNSKIYSFEASPANFELLKLNINSNNIKNIRAYNKGITSKKSNLKFYISNKSSGLNSFIKPKVYEKEMIIHCDSLDNIFRKLKTCDALKIDVEGVELDVLKGAKKLLKHTNRVAIEVCSKTSKDVKDFLKKNKFNFTVKWPIIYGEKIKQ